MNAQELITAALRKLRVKKRGFDLSADDAVQGLEALNRMIEFWSIDDLIVPYRTRESLTLTAGTNPHTIGVGGDLNTVQPTDIHVAVIRSGTQDFPLDIKTVHDYQYEDDKSTQQRPQYLYFERGQTLGNIYFDNVPDQAYTLILDSIKPLTGFATLTTDAALLAEYQLAIIWNLAVELAPEYGKEPSQTVTRRATQTYDALSWNTVSSRVPIMTIDPALRSSRRFHINEIN